MDKIYPFKFLDPYDKNDTQLFFGRDDEINDLYQMIFQTNILLVYGASGTGKTSLIQCGLASKFQAHDWLALSIRRGTNLNESFDRALAEAGGNAPIYEKVYDPTEEDDDDDSVAVATQLSPLARSFKAIYLSSFRPIYLIFDQFEELFVLGNAAEQTKFIETVKEIQALEQPVKMIFSIREEYLGHLYEFEKAVPQLMRKKMRVEPMNLDKVHKVIHGVSTFEGSNISVKSGEEREITEGIFRKIKGKEKSLTIQLPYLQVFLDKLYDEITHDDSHKADAVFTVAALNNMGDIGDVMRSFLEEQVTAISGRLSTPNSKVGIDTIWKILSPFATLEGTKEPITMTALLKRLPGMDKTLVATAVKAFETSRILRHNEDGDIYELAHDSLAGKIAGKRTDEEIALLEVERLIKSQLALNVNSREFFSAKQIAIIDLCWDKLTPRLNEDDKAFVALSKEKIAEKIEAEKRKAQEEADAKEKARIAEELKKKKQRQQTLSIMVGVMVVLVGLVVYALRARAMAMEKENEAVMLKSRAEDASKEAMKAKEEVTATLNSLQRNNAMSKAKQWHAYAQSYMDNNNYDFAKESIESAINELKNDSVTSKSAYMDTLRRDMRKCDSMLKNQ